MKKFLLILTVAACAACGRNDLSDITVVPFPNDVEVLAGDFNAAGAAFHYSAEMDQQTVNLVEAFAAKLSLVTSKESEVAEGTGETGFVFAVNAELPEEAYTLSVDRNCVKVEASSLRGFNYAIQTIKQMLPVEIYAETPASADWTIPCVKINDAPRFGYRGLHLDESRHFFGMEEVKRYLDIMEVHKLNTLHWHLTDDQGWRIEIKKYPELTSVGSKRSGTCVKKDFKSTDGVPYGEGMWYTQDQIREIIDYAAAKGIDVLPEIDLPGHMLAALTAYPELGCTGGPYSVWTRWGISDDVLCAGNEKVYEFLENVLSEVCELFPYKYVHVGGDECPKVRWEKCPKCQAKIRQLGYTDKDGQKAEHFLQSYVISRMEKFLNSKGKSVIGWDEILEGEVAPNATIMSWRGETGGLRAVRMGHDAIMTPNTYFYIDYYQSMDIKNEPFGIGGYLPVERCYSYEPYPEGMTDEEKSHILGVQANMWTEYVATPEHLEYMVLPRLAALAEVQWCAADRKDWNRFEDSADEFCKIYETMGYNYATHVLQVRGEVIPDPENRCAKVVLSAQGDTPIRYTLDGSTPDSKSMLYKDTLVIDKTCTLTAVAMRGDVEPKYFVKPFTFHKAVGRQIVSSAAPHKSYKYSYPGNLLDGVRSACVYKSGDWAGWRKPFEVVIDMEGSGPYSTVTLGTLLAQASYILGPAYISVMVSEDGKEFVEVVRKEYEPVKHDEDDVAVDYEVAFPETSARYLKVAAGAVTAMPEWHFAAGRTGSLFIDEVIVK
ncbi:MAG: family 20 glycosylhydrolase [Bacteroidales bacterium]|nr:family 20 glycosylhydrolase [Bacteroidales bacterium]